MEKWKIDIEAKNLTKYEKLCVKLIGSYASKNRNNMDVFEERQIKQLLSRMFQNESVSWDSIHFLCKFQGHQN